ncbi:MAG: glutamate racemase [Armatimonadetes bacterium]|nr:glutamate racemase [Armatimonadota bacterium]MDE2207067.1 glutamate racemase [Armatimonadota bacterium]
MSAANPEMLGVFDSGVGGLSVLNSIAAAGVNLPTLYVADQANVPYGGRPLDQIRNYAAAICRALVRAGCTHIVMACNISSAVAYEIVRAEHRNLIVIGVIEPGAAAAARLETNRVAVLATKGTVESQAYRQAFHRIDPGIEVGELACPELVPLVEAGVTTGEEAVVAARMRMAQVQSYGARTVVLGCTHYPFLLPVLRAAAPEVRFVDPAEATAQLLRSYVSLNNGGPQHVRRLITTGSRHTLQKQAAAMMNGTDFTVAEAVWKGDELLLPVGLPT